MCRNTLSSYVLIGDGLPILMMTGFLNLFFVIMSDNKIWKGMIFMNSFLFVKKIEKTLSLQSVIIMVVSPAFRHQPTDESVKFRRKVITAI